MTDAIVSAYLDKFDFPLFHETPPLKYMVATVPRSGSTFFANTIWSTGCLGCPLEYTNLRGVGLMRDRFRHMQSKDYWTQVQKIRTSPNGIFGFKTFVPDLVDILRSQPDLLPLVDSRLVIYFTRRDKVAQAVSYYLASKTGRWSFDSSLPGAVEFDFNSIEFYLNLIDVQERDWETLFRVTDTHPLRLYYEDFVNDPHRQTEVVAEYLDARLDPSLVIKTPLLKTQSDDANLRWICEFNAGRAAAIS